MTVTIDGRCTLSSEQAAFPSKEQGGSLRAILNSEPPGAGKARGPRRGLSLSIPQMRGSSAWRARSTCFPAMASIGSKDCLSATGVSVLGVRPGTSESWAGQGDRS